VYSVACVRRRPGTVRTEQHSRAIRHGGATLIWLRVDGEEAFDRRPRRRRSRRAIELGVLFGSPSLGRSPTSSTNQSTDQFGWVRAQQSRDSPRRKCRDHDQGVGIMSRRIIFTASATSCWTEGGCGTWGGSIRPVRRVFGLSVLAHGGPFATSLGGVGLRWRFASPTIRRRRPARVVGGHDHSTSRRNCPYRGMMSPSATLCPDSSGTRATVPRSTGPEKSGSCAFDQPATTPWPGPEPSRPSSA